MMGLWLSPSKKKEVRVISSLLAQQDPGSHIDVASSSLESVDDDLAREAELDELLDGGLGEALKG